MSTDNQLHTDKRWRAVLEYRSDHGVVDVEHFFEEIADLHAIIERGPNWACLLKCTVTLNISLPGLETLTIEGEKQL